MPPPDDPAPAHALAADDLLPLVYDELRRLSEAQIAAEYGAVTVSATGLVHEAYFKLAGRGAWTDRAHFLAVAVHAMRQVLVDRARARQAAKRTPPAEPALPADADADRDADRTLAVDRALGGLASRNADLARLVELRFFGGLEVAEAAEVLGVSERTAARMWQRARAHLHAALGPDSLDAPARLVTA